MTTFLRTHCLQSSPRFLRQLILNFSSILHGYNPFKSTCHSLHVSTYMPVDHTYPPYPPQSSRTISEPFQGISTPTVPLSGVGIESCTLGNTMNAGIRAMETITQPEVAEESPTDNALKRNKARAAFQLLSNAIPDDAGHIKVSKFIVSHWPVS